MKRLIFLFAPLLCCQMGFLHAQGIVDCVNPATLNVSRVKGQVFDPTGVVVPRVAVSLTSEQGTNLTAISDREGRFRFPAATGRYQLKSALPMFQPAAVELDVGKDAVRLINPSDIRVILGLAGSFCPWVTTSNREFQRIIRANKKRLKETVQYNATQK